MSIEDERDTSTHPGVRDIDIVDSLFYASPDGLLLFNETDEEIFINQTLGDILGLKCDIWRKKSRSVTVVPKEAHEEIRTHFPFLFLKPKVVNEEEQFHITTRDGRDEFLSVHKRLYIEQTTVFQCVFVRLVSEAVALAQKAEVVDSMLRHEVLNHAGGISSAAQLLLRNSSLDGKEREFLGVIQESADEVVSLVRNKGELLKLESGSLKLDLEEFDVIKTLRKIRSRLAALTSAQHSSFNVLFEGKNLDTASPLLIEGDRELLERAIENLVKNAIEASHSEEKVVIRLVEDEDTLTIDIHNWGVIPEGIQKTFFQKYTTSKKHGQGIGVYLSNLIILTHRGKITFTTNIEEGTHVVVRIPLMQKRV